MSLSFSLLTNGSSASSASDVTASVTLTSGDLFLMLILNENSSGSTRNHAVSSGWSEENFVSDAGDRDVMGLTVLSRIGDGSTGAITMGFTGQSQSFWNWQIIRIQGQSASSPIVQKASAGGNTGDPATTLSAFADPTNNAAFCVATHFVSATTVEAGWTQISAATGDLGFVSGFKIGQDTTPSQTAADGDDWLIWAAEIAVAASGGATILGKTIKNSLFFDETFFERASSWIGKNYGGYPPPRQQRLVISQYTRDPDNFEVNYSRTFKPIGGVVPVIATVLAKTIKSQYSVPETFDTNPSRITKPIGGTTAPPPTPIPGKVIKNPYIEDTYFEYANAVFLASASPGIIAGVPPHPTINVQSASLAQDEINNFPKQFGVRIAKAIGGAIPALVNTPRITIKNVYWEDFYSKVEYQNRAFRGAQGAIIGLPRRNFMSPSLQAVYGEMDVLGWPKMFGARLNRPAQGGDGPLPPGPSTLLPWGFVGVGLWRD